MSIQSSTIVLRDDGISYGDYVERRLSVAPVRASRLLQAVLKSAFEGRL